MQKIILLLTTLANFCLATLLPYGLQNGDSSLGHGDDKSYSVNTTRAIKFENQMFNEFYVSSNGAIFTHKYDQIDPSRDFSRFPSHSILVYFSDSKVDDSCTKRGCSIFTRTTVSSSDIAVIENLVNKYDYGFTVDVNRTLVVTWFNIKAFYDEELENTFQAVITSDGFKTFCILSYEKLEYYKDPSPRKRFAKIGFKGQYRNACELPGSNSDPTKLTCRSNVNIPGVFLTDLTNISYIQCSPGKSVDFLPYKCSHCPGEETWLHLNCPLTYTPVCGEDGKTYNNICEFHKQACRRNSTLFITHSGKCNGTSFTTTPVTTGKLQTTVPTIVFDCDFESGVCGLALGQWLHDRGGTPSTGTGPSVDASGSSYGWYIYREATGESDGSKASFSLTVQNSNRFLNGCLHFAYHMYGSSMGTLNVYYGPNWLQLKVFSISGDQKNIWHQKAVTLNDSSILGFSSFQIVFESIRGDDFTSDIALDEISVTMGKTCSVTLPPTTPATKFDCDFESGVCGLYLGKWLRDCCGTPSTGTGPSVDGTGSSYGYYIYREATGESIDSKESFSLTMQNSNRLLTGCLHFAYHMYGSSMGTLNVYYGLYSSTQVKIVSISGNQQNVWHRMVVLLNDSTILGQSSFRIEFESVRGESYTSDIALDEISVEMGKNCSVTLPPTTPATRTPTPATGNKFDCDFESGVCGLYLGKWLRDCCGTPSTGTGPSVDGTGSSYGYYIYREATGESIDSKESFSLTMQNSNRLLTGCLHFAYHMYGSSMGTLNVYYGLYSSTQVKIVSISGNQQNVWHRMVVLLNDSTILGQSSFRIVFESVRGDGFKSDIALDEISVEMGKNCSVSPTDKTVLYPYGFSADNIAKPGDSAITTVYLPRKIPLFSVNSDRLYISTNGVVSINRALSRGSAIPSSYTFISVFDNDLDTSTSGNIFYRFTTDQSILRKADRDIQRLNNSTFFSSSAVVITYSNVPRYWSSLSTHTFQLVLATNGNITFSILNYLQLDSIPTAVGYSETMCNYQKFASKYTLVSSSNIGIPGRHVYQLSNYKCFRPLIGLYSFQSSFYVQPGISTMYSVIKLPNADRNGDIDITTAELIGESANSHAIFIKKVEPTMQKYSIFSANQIHELKLIQLSIIYAGTPKNSSFQYGKLIITDAANIPQCQYVTFTITMLTKPSVKLTVEIGLTVYDSLYHTHAWLRNVSKNGFEACYKEAYGFSGFRNITLNYIAVVVEQNSNEQVKEYGRILFPKNRTNLCRRVPFKFSYFKNKFVSISPIETFRTIHTSFKSWLINVTSKEFVICASSSQDSFTRFNVDMEVNYFVEGTFSPCYKFKCPSHLECLISLEKPYCGCKQTCFFKPKEDGFCGTDSMFYKNQCDLDRHHCLVNGIYSKSNVQVAYMGKCQHLPYQVGIKQLDVLPGKSTVYCKYIKLDEFDFGTSGEIYVQLSVSWNRHNTSSMLHNATAVWSETISTQGFKACAKVTSQHYVSASNRPFVHWMAYQDGFVAGTNTAFVLNLTTWYSRDICKTLFAIPFDSSVLVTVEQPASTSYEKALVVRKDTRRVCVREIQNLDGPFIGVRIHVLVMNSTRSPFISEVANITMRGEDHSTDGLLCKTVAYNLQFPSLPNPTVIISGVGRYSGSVWIEETTENHLSLCHKSLDRYISSVDVIITYAVLPELCVNGWVYSGGSCYKSMNDCASYEQSKRRCIAINSTLPVVNTAGEEFYLEQTVLNHHIWLGLTDVNMENVWVWDTGSNSSFQKWLPGRPNGGKSENCAVIKRDGNITGWEDLACSSCANIQCEKDADLLNRSCADFCQNGGVCSISTNAISGNRNMFCSCLNGFYGLRCDIDVGALDECNNYTLHNEEWRRLSSSTSFTLQSNDTSCDAKQLKEGWHRFSGAAGTQLHNTICPPFGNQCGTRSPGWLKGRNPSVMDGIVTRMLRYRTFYCADDSGEVQIRNCGTFYTYKFIRLPYWSCQYGLCTKN